jgi:hypothetical protein
MDDKNDTLEISSPLESINFCEQTLPMENIGNQIAKLPQSLSNIGKTLAKLVGSMIEAFASVSLSPTWIEIKKTFADIAKTTEQARYNEFIFRQHILKLWSDLEEELKTKNRYFPDSEFLSLFENCSKEARRNFRKGNTLYRARKIEIDKLPSETRNVIAKATEDFNDYGSHNSSNMVADIWEHLANIESGEWEQIVSNETSEKSILFWGYGANDSGAPPSSEAQGRVNPMGVSYLYAAKDERTAIAEIQPTIGQLISIAKIKTLKPLNIFCFDFYEAFSNSEVMNLTIDELEEQLGFSYWRLKVLFDTMSELFSKPTSGNHENYYATQYISEYIKKMGFDGIKFKSSLKKGGINIVLFDISKDANDNPVNYEILSSSLHIVKNVRVSSAQVLPRKT